MESIGQFGEATNTTDSEDHQRIPGMRNGRSRSLSRRMMPGSRAHALVAAISRLEQEHLALLMALCDLEDTSIKSQDAVMRSTLYVLLREDLRRTQHALSRASQGTYGICEVCQQPLSRRHLSLLPAMTSCSSCTGRLPREH